NGDCGVAKKLAPAGHRALPTFVSGTTFLDCISHCVLHNDTCCSRSIVDAYWVIPRYGKEDSVSARAASIPRPFSAHSAACLSKGLGMLSQQRGGVPSSGTIRQNSQDQ